MKTFLALLAALLACPLHLSAQRKTPLTLDTVVVSLPAQGEQHAVDFTLRDLMRQYRIPGISVAVVQNNQLAWSAGFGVVAPGSAMPVSPTTLFQAASISKPITAAGGLWLVEHGKLQLDRNVNLGLKGWQVPENAFTANEKVTLRRLMSHSAGLSVHGFGGYAKGTPLPTTVQTLDGTPPANNPAVRVIAVPGGECIYSGGGITVEMLLMQQASGQRFEDFMMQHVLKPAGMTSSTFQQDLPASMAHRAASGTHSDGTVVPGGWHIYPELAPDGLWTTPSDLARFGMELSLSRQGKANHILSQSMTQQMLTPQCHDTPGDAGGIGLGFGVGYGGHPGRFRHTGGNDGFESFLMMDADAGWGIAFMGNSDSFHLLYPSLVDAVAKLQGWDYATKPVSLNERLSLIAGKLGSAAALADFDLAPAADRAKPAALNSLGYFLLQQGNTADAEAVFQRNVALHPEDANVYDSLGEAYMQAGDKPHAIQNYSMSLKLNPGNKNAKRQLDRLSVQK